VRERAWLREAVEAGQPLFGICLGAELLAACLGAAVRQGRAEAGWVDVERLDALGRPSGNVRARTWHDDTFELPAGATRLGRSVACSEQAFQLGRVVGLQFHPEWTPEIVAALFARYGEQMPAALREPGDDSAAHAFLGDSMDAWLLGPRA